MKTTTTLVTTIAVSFALMGSPLCQAQEAEADKKQQQFEKLDTDKNGSLSLEEYTAIVKSPQRAKHFTRLDTDKNGSLSLQEFSKPPAKKGKKKPAAE